MRFRPAPDPFLSPPRLEGCLKSERLGRDTSRGRNTTGISDSDEADLKALDGSRVEDIQVLGGSPAGAYRPLFLGARWRALDQDKGGRSHTNPPCSHAGDQFDVRMMESWLL